MRELAERVAEGICGEAGVRHSPVVPVREIARALDVVVDDKPMEEDGLLCPNGHMAYAFLNAAQPESRRRFSLGHELAHWVLLSGRTEAGLTSADRQGIGNEEYFCDKVSGALLMPEWWVESRYRSSRHQFSAIEDLAGQAQVSLSAALLRLRDVLGWRRTLLPWTRRDGRWVFDGEAGLMPVQQGNVRTTEGTRYVLSTTRAADPVPVELPLLFAGREALLRGEVLVTASRAVALVKLPYVEARPAVWPPSSRSFAARPPRVQR